MIRAGARIAQGLIPLAIVLLGADVALAQDASFAAAGVDAQGKSMALTWAFRALATLTLAAALATVLMRNPVVAALCLVVTLFLTGGLYLLLHATFLAAIQVLVYAGAIMVLFIFVVMSVGHPEREELGLTRGTLTKVVGAAALGVVVLRVVATLTGPSIPQPALVADTFGNVNQIGRLLFTKYLFPFEALSLLLLVAIVGAVMVSRRRSRREGEQTATQRVEAP